MSLTTDYNVHKLINNISKTLQSRHNGRNGVSNHQPDECLLNRLFRHTSKKTSKLRVTGLCAGNYPMTGEFPAQMSSNAENVSIWWCQHDNDRYGTWNTTVKWYAFQFWIRFQPLYIHISWNIMLLKWLINICLCLRGITKFIWQTWGRPGSCWPQVDPTLAPWTMLSGHL